VLDFQFLNARHGDCFLVRWGAGRVMLVDGGPDTVYEGALKTHLAELPLRAPSQRVLDVVCLSHVDEDHVVGILRLLIELGRIARDGLPVPIRISRFWFNSVEELVEANSPGLAAAVRPLLDRTQVGAVMAASYNQGREIRDRAAALNLAGNSPFGGPLLQGAKTTIDDLEIIVVAPDQTALNKLSTKWKEAKKKKDPSVIGSAYADKSIPNLSSIVLYLKHQGRAALLTGDARGDHILAGLKRTGLLSRDVPLHVNLLKLPHHGSNHNVKREFFQRIHADHYVISADGVKYHHPHEETLGWLVESRDPGEHFVVYLTNDIPFAVKALEKLHNGRNFDVVVRPKAEQVLVVPL
jgi:beta-lactamase superfamily II metal-dependent hydrolase